MENQQNTLIIFTDKSDEVLSGIMTKYRLEENYEKMVQNIKEKKDDAVVILKKLTTSFANGVISDKILSDSIQQQIGVAVQMANEIAKEIITILVPTIKKMSEADIDKLNETIIVQPENNIKENLMPRIKAPIEVEKIFEQRRAETLQGKVTGPAQNQPAPITPAPAKKIAKPVVKKQGPDTYREPIE